MPEAGDGPADLDMLWEVVREGDRASIEALLIGDDDHPPLGVSIDVRDEKGMTPLHWLAVEGHASVVQWMVDEIGAEVDLGDALHKLHPSFVQCLKFIVQVPMPGRRERAQLWRRSLPSRCPVAVSPEEFADLGSRFGSLSGGAINRAAFRAAAAVALLQPKPAGGEGGEEKEEKEGAKKKNPPKTKTPTATSRCVTFADLEKAAEQESRKGEGEASRMYAAQFL